MGLLFRFLEDFRRWDRPSQLALLLALLTFLVFLLLGFSLSDQTMRIAAIVGAAGALVAAQFVVLWGNRHLLNDFAHAQKLYLAGDYAAARDLLLRMQAAGGARWRSNQVREWMLLGHVLRNLGDLEGSETYFRQALQAEPASHFPLYGLGRTLICKGQYAEAAEHLQAALDAGAPLIARFDLGYALYRAADYESAGQVLGQAVADDLHRELMRQFLLFRLGKAEAPGADQVRVGLPLWQKEMEQVGRTPYTEVLVEDLVALEALTNEES